MKRKLTNQSERQGVVSCRLTLVSVSGGRVGYEVSSGVQHTLNVLVLTLTLMVYVISNDILKWNS